MTPNERDVLGEEGAESVNLKRGPVLSLSIFAEDKQTKQKSRVEQFLKAGHDWSM